MEENRGKLILERKMRSRFLPILIIVFMFFITCRGIGGTIGGIRRGDFDDMVFGSFITIIGIILICVSIFLFKAAVFRVYTNGVALPRPYTLKSISQGNFYRFDQINNIVYQKGTVALFPAIIFSVENRNKLRIYKKIMVDVRSKEVYDLVIQTRDEYFRKNVNDLNTV